MGDISQSLSIVRVRACDLQPGLRFLRLPVLTLIKQLYCAHKSYFNALNLFKWSELLILAVTTSKIKIQRQSLFYQKTHTTKWQLQRSGVLIEDGPWSG